MAASVDYYRVLEITETANVNDIKKAYKKLAWKWRPDKNLENADEANKKFKEISEAYEVLSDDKNRKIYEQYVKKKLVKGGGRSSNRQRNRHNAESRNFDFVFRDPEEVFREFLDSCDVSELGQMAKVRVCNVNVLNNPSPFNSPSEVEVTDWNSASDISCEEICHSKTPHIRFHIPELENILIKAVCEFRKKNLYMDCKLVVSSASVVKAHKIILSAMSPYLRQRLSNDDETFPIVDLNDVELEDLESILDLMYKGNVCISSSRLPVFLKHAEKYGMEVTTEERENAEVCVKIPTHGKTMFEMIGGFFKSGEIIDFVIEAENTFGKAHKVLFSAFSQYFHVTLNDDYNKLPKVIMKELGLNALKSLFCLFYLGATCVPLNSSSEVEKFFQKLRIPFEKESRGGENVQKFEGEGNVPDTNVHEKDPTLREIEPEESVPDTDVRETIPAVRIMKGKTRSESYISTLKCPSCDFTIKEMANLTEHLVDEHGTALTNDEFSELALHKS
ncbi:uncharacterized protein LOC135834245 isoform X1 [Planococcus citri]|uniref:uncharacterized protein LOC135834245 isoform X1 n=1 Tax=Planococcus citri TaxID=170843 RepID=UPI0031F8EF13